jgi:lipoprotein-anchoring transpeptidase ErfK/SrfK
MNTLRLSLAAMVVAAAVTGQAIGQDAAKTEAQPVPNPVTTQEQPTAAAPAVKRVIVVSLEDRKLALVEDGQVIKVYDVAVGKPSTPSPVGTFFIERRVENPTYHHDGRTVAPGPHNPVGSRWMGLSEHGYGIHGTNEPKSIGKAASHGCIRMGKADVEQLYGLVAEGDTVELVGARNEETARLFGDGQKPAVTTAAPAMTVAIAPAAPPVQTNVQDAGSTMTTSLTVAAIAAFAVVR